MSPDKSDLRKQVRARLASLGIEARREASAEVCRRLLALPEVAAARSALLYLPLPREVDLLPAGRLLLAGGVVTAVPRVVATSAEFEAVMVDRLPDDPLADTADRSKADFVIDDLGVRTPVGGRVLPIEALDLIVVPGLAFDATGARLGRGGGYYDRALARRRPGTVALGVAFDVQVVDRVPTEPHDAHVDAVLTERRIVYTRPRHRDAVGE